MVTVSSNKQSKKNSSVWEALAKGWKWVALALLFLQLFTFDTPSSFGTGRTLMPVASSHQEQVIHDKKAHSPYTYAFVLGGVDPSKPSYRGLLYSIFVAVYALQKHGSKADVVLFVQLSNNVDSSTVETNPSGLTPTEQQVLQSLNIQLRQIPPSTSESFRDITMNKFIILTLTEYRKVVFVDADIVPVNNLDYLFEAADGPNAFLKDNFYLATSGEPANAGLFLLTPRDGDYEQALDIIKRQKESAKNLPGKAKFDILTGWGHVIEPPDHWETTRPKGRGTNWTFYCAPSDQGFLYHWTKYHKKSVSIMVRNELKNWGSHSTNGTVVWIEQTLHAPFDKIPNTLNWTLKNEWDGCQNSPNKWGCLAPHRDYVHLAGTWKPWRLAIPEGAFTTNSTKDAWHYWFHLFHGVNEEYGMGIDFNHWEEERKLYAVPPLGFKPEYYPEKCSGCKFT